MTPELSHIVKLSEIGTAAKVAAITADEKQRIALAKRFTLPKIDALHATYKLQMREDKITLNGLIDARLEQLCAISGETFPVQIAEDFNVIFTAKSERIASDEEVELSEGDCDIMEYEGNKIDIGEAIAQTLYLALDPFPRGPNADAIAEKQGLKSEEEAGPFGALAALKDKLGKDKLG